MEGIRWAKHTRSQRWLSCWLLPAALAIWSAPASAQDAIAANWSELKSNSVELKRKAESLSSKIEILQSDNEGLNQSLLEQQELSWQQQERLQTSLSLQSETSSLLENSNRYIISLEMSIRRNRRAWQIGIPIAIVIGIVSGAKIGEPNR